MENISFSDPETESKSSGSFFGNIFSLLRSKKVLVGVTVAFTLLLGGTAGFLAWRLQKTEEPVSETPASAAGCTGTKLSDYCGGDKPDLCDVSNYECHGDCLKAWGRCCDFCGAGNTCDDGHFGWVEDCTAQGEECIDGACRSSEPAPEECKVSWADGSETFTYNGQEITIEQACLTVHAENCHGQPVGFTRYHCYDGFDPEIGCSDNPVKKEFTIDSDDYWKTMCLHADFGGAPPDCPVGQTDGAVGNPNVSNDAVLWEIGDQYCEEEELTGPRCNNITAEPTGLPYFGGTVTLTVQATQGDGGALSYTWGSDAGSIDPNAASGDNKAVWDLTSLTNDTYQPSTHYAWVKVSNDVGSSGCDDQDTCTADGGGCVLALDLAPFPEEDITCDDLTISPSPSEIELGDSVSITCQGSSRWSYQDQRDNPYPIVRIDFKVYLDPKVGSAFDGFQENEQIAGSPFSVDVAGQGPTWSATYPASSSDAPIVIDKTGTWGVASRVCANVQGTVQCTNYATPSP
ncbi:MAG: hypothetical protein U9M98_02490 [Patescibacteria group bacterium]|nr:hypothetical protein [Patescibacteria group bacterium]